VMAFWQSANLPGACTDEFHPTNWQRTQFVVSQMCSDTGGSPGHLVKWNMITNVYTIWEQGTLTDFNPHGGDWNPSGNGFVITDFVLPISLFSTSFVFRDTVRYFDNNGNLLYTFNMPAPSNAGYIATRWVSNTKAITAASASQNVMYVLDTVAHSVTAVLDFGALIHPAFNAGLPLVNIDFQRGFIAFGLRYLVLFSWDNNYNFSIVQTYDFCSAVYTPCSGLVNGVPGSHYLALSLDQSRLMVSNNFVTVGNAQFPGRGTINSFTIGANWTSFSAISRFNPTVGGLAHGIASAYVSSD